MARFGMSFDEFSTLADDSSGLSKQEFDQVLSLLTPSAQDLFHSLLRHGIFLGEVGHKEQWGDLKKKPVLVDYGLNKETDKFYK